MRVVKVLFSLSKFRLAGENICASSSLGMAIMAKTGYEYSWLLFIYWCSSSQRSFSCFPLSLSVVLFIIRKETMPQNAGIGPISLLLEPASGLVSQGFLPDCCLFRQTSLWVNVYIRQRLLLRYILEAKATNLVGMGWTFQSYYSSCYLTQRLPC